MIPRQPSSDRRECAPWTPAVQRQSVKELVKSRRKLQPPAAPSVTAPVKNTRIRRGSAPSVSVAVAHTIARRRDKSLRHRSPSPLVAWAPCHIHTAAPPTSALKADPPAVPAKTARDKENFLTAVPSAWDSSISQRPTSVSPPSSEPVTLCGDDGAAAAANRQRRGVLRHFLAQRRALQCLADTADMPSQTVVRPPPPPTTAVGHSTGTRPCESPVEYSTATSDMSGTQPRLPARPARTPPHPWADLLRLATSTFNDSPLSTFMATLSLQCPPTGSAADHGPVTFRLDLRDSPTQACEIHVDDIGATRFHVEVPHTGYVSPVQSLVRALCMGAADGDGEADEDAPRADARPAHDANFTVELLFDEQEPENADALKVAAHEEFLRDREHAPLAAPVPRENSASMDTSTGTSASKNTATFVEDVSHTLRTHANPSEVYIADLDGTLSQLRSINASVFLSQRQLVESWKRYSTTVALTLCLAQAGVCDADSLPFLAVQLVSVASLLAGWQTRAELASACPSRRAKRLSDLAKKDAVVPAGLLRPIARKGVLRRIPEASDVAPSIAVEPFTDAEVFQLFYLQLVFRAFYDIRFPHMTWRGDRTVTKGFLRADLLGAQYCKRHALAFEHPCRANAWLLFPQRSRILVILDLAHAVIPLYATPRELQATAALPLFGSTADVPCLSSFGRGIVQWAATQTVDSSRAASQLLGTLFDQFGARYGCTRTTVWHSVVPPKTFRCRERLTFAAMERCGGALRRFFVPGEARDLDCNALSPSQHARSQCGTPLVAAAPSRPLSRRPSVLLRLPQPSASSGREVLTRAVAAGSEADVHDRASLDHSHIMSCAASFSVLDVPAPATDNAAEAEKSTSASMSALRDDRRTTGDIPETSDAETQDAFAMTVAATSPFTQQESLVTRWRYYAHQGSISVFDGLTSGLELYGFLGRGGSGLVYRGRYGKRQLPVAVKVFVIPDGMEHDNYVRESLTDVAFFVLMNQLDDYGICSTCRAHDFIVSSVPPKGLSEEDATMARRGRDAATTQLCYLITDLMDGTLGRFLTENDEDFDPCYDTLLNSPLRDGELFQLLFVQLAVKSMFDYKILDLMLNSQLRGDNVGVRFVSLTAKRKMEFEADPQLAAQEYLARNYYDGILVAFQRDRDDAVRYLRFPADLEPDSPKLGPLRFVYFIDLGQGMQPNVAELTKQRLIGETVVDSCVEDDGFGRYWPLNELYCRYVDVQGKFADEVVRWGSQVRVSSQEDAAVAMGDLLELFYSRYGIPQPTPEMARSHLLFTWSPSTVAELKKAYVYRPEPS